MNALEKLIKEKIRDAGPLCFAEFMELALYHYQYGYYVSHKPKIGKTGDFFTAPHVTDLFGRTIAKNIRKHFDDKPVKIIEFGAGNGWLAKDITDDFNGQNIDYEYAIIEISDSMVEKQQELLKGRHVKWVNSINDIAPDTYFILANELLDAMPVHRVKRINGQLKEMKVGLKNDELEDLPAAPDPEVLWFLKKNPEYRINVLEGEVNIKAVSWLNDVIRKLKSGAILIIDYGYTSQELAHYPNGTLNCFYEHTSTGNPYINIGLQDITAYVNFSPLMEIVQKLSLENKLISQSAFLIENGIFEEQQKRALKLNELERFKMAMSVKTLVMPNAMGEKFKCLMIEKR